VKVRVEVRSPGRFRQEIPVVIILLSPLVTACYGTPFEVGASIVVTAASGQLYLGVNTDSFSGNAGIWTVKIKIGGQP
jgi:hypothetical protein